ncbi:2214_t:CDS:2, partial [Paraglomus occultum]
MTLRMVFQFELPLSMREIVMRAREHTGNEQEEFEIGVNSLIEEQTVKFNEIIESLRNTYGNNYTHQLQYLAHSLDNIDVETLTNNDLIINNVVVVDLGVLKIPGEFCSILVASLFAETGMYSLERQMQDLGRQITWKTVYKRKQQFACVSKVLELCGTDLPPSL